MVRYSHAPYRLKYVSQVICTLNAVFCVQFIFVYLINRLLKGHTVFSMDSNRITMNP